ncbi:hypothetical protein [Nostoc sp.]|uniref:hypothetical protein n=1 Tax=Nostoc sp. TaxID=1180 RepID=UPI002FFC7EB6
MTNDKQRSLSASFWCWRSPLFALAYPLGEASRREKKASELLLMETLRERGQPLIVIA